MMNQNNESNTGNIYRTHRILILGCGYSGVDTALRLSESGNVVKIMDIQSDSFSRIPKDKIDSNRIEPILGDGIFEYDLRRAVRQKIDIFIAATGITSVNITAAQLAIHVIKIPKVICLVDDEDIEEIYSQIGLQILNKRKLTVEHILIDSMEHK